MTDATNSVLLRQFDIAWQLAWYHLELLEDDECLWRPARRGLHVHRDSDGAWHADWPEREGYDIGPPSIAWLTWHVLYWWSMVLNHSFGDASLTRDAVTWPGSMDAVRTTLQQFREQWTTPVQQLREEDFASSSRTRWPFHDRPFADVVAWLNVELTKNAAEIGYARFLHASHKGVR
jgi:hypothetical protein